MRYSVEQAQEYSEAGMPIMLAWDRVEVMLMDHGITSVSDIQEVHALETPEGWDAWAVLMWLGY